MAYIEPELVAKAKEMDLLTYLKNYEPGQLVKLPGGEYCTKEHDSLKISNGKWCWWSRGIGGRSALDYLIKVQDIPFLEAVEIILGQAEVRPPKIVQQTETKKGQLTVPKMTVSPTIAYEYLTEKRMIDWEIVMDCFAKKMIMETQNHEVAFIGYDEKGAIRCINVRATDDSDFKKTLYGSDRRFAFRLVSENENPVLHLYEGAIDLLSYITILKEQGVNYKEGNFLSLGGVYQPKKEIEKSTVPVALQRYLAERKTTKIMVHFDNDFAGRRAVETLKIILPEYEVKNYPPPTGKDYNDYLILKRVHEMKRKSKEVCR